MNFSYHFSRKQRIKNYGKRLQDQNLKGENHCRPVYCICVLISHIIIHVQMCQLM